MFSRWGAYYSKRKIPQLKLIYNNYFLNSNGQIIMPTQLTEELSKRLRAARKAAGFKSAKEFAKEYGVPVSTYSQHETGKRSISSDLIMDYSAYFKIKPCWLLTGEGEPFLVEGQKDKKAIIAREVFSISPNVNENHIKYQHIDLALLKRILLAAETLFEDESVKLSYSGLIHHCFDIYDTVSTLNADAEEKDKIINLTLSSIKRGSLTMI
jgi:transcriptional regulator with XRE-family HTH domain